MTRGHVTALIVAALIVTAVLPVAAVAGGDAGPLAMLRELVEDDRSPDHVETESLPEDPKALLELLPEPVRDAPAVDGRNAGVGIRDADDDQCVDAAYVVAYTSSGGGYVDPAEIDVNGLSDPTDPDSRTCGGDLPYVIGSANGTIDPSASRTACAEPTQASGQRIGGWADDPGGDACRSGFSTFTAAGYVGHVQFRFTHCSGWGCTYYWYEFVTATIPDEPEGDVGVVEIAG